MTLYAVPVPADSPPTLETVPTLDARPALDVAPGVPVEAGPEVTVDVLHDHDWRLVQVHFADGASVREYTCGDCAAVWFA